MGLLANLGAQKVRELRKSEMVHIGEGLMPLPRRTVERIQAGEFVEFAEFPVLDDGSKVEQVEQELGDRVVIFQVPERKKSEASSGCLLVEQLIHPLRKDGADGRTGPGSRAQRVQGDRPQGGQVTPMGVREELRRKAAAGDRARSRARVDSSLFMQELAGPQAAFLATGARNGGVLEGTGPRKRSRESGSGIDPGGSEKRGPGTCHRFSGQEGICHCGNRCKFRHCCAKCKGPHPGARCGNTQSEW